MNQVSICEGLPPVSTGDGISFEFMFKNYVISDREKYYVKLEVSNILQHIYASMSALIPNPCNKQFLIFDFQERVLVAAKTKIPVNAVFNATGYDLVSFICCSTINSADQAHTKLILDLSNVSDQDKRLFNRKILRTSSEQFLD